MTAPPSNPPTRRSGPRPLVEPLTLRLPQLPPALTGFTLLFLCDLHVRRSTKLHERLLRELQDLEVDLLLFGGDLMNEPGSEPATHELIQRLVLAARPRLGALGVWGNHDSPALRRRLDHLPITWLTNTAWAAPRLPLSVLGVDCVRGEYSAPRGDLLAAASAVAPLEQTGEPPFRILLAHLPNWVPIAASLDIDLTLCGHTHGGQLRTPNRIYHNASPGWPLHLSSGILQTRRSLALISRGLGETTFTPAFRLFCPPHAPLITLSPSRTPITPTLLPTCIQWW
jgi:predicted MPP superfamily phosphohydrolase